MVMSAHSSSWVRIICVAISLCGVRGAAVAQPEKPRPGDAMIERWLQKQAERLDQRFLDGAKTRAEWEERRPRLHREYLYMLGLWPLPEKTPLHATITGTVERGEVLIEKLHVQSKPGLYVTGNLYRPKTITGKLPAILYVCGHSGKGRDGNKTAFQDHGMWFANNGYICLIVDTLQLGEIPGIHHGTYGTPYRHFGSYGLKGQDTVENRWWWQARGYTPAGVECWNGIRALDYLVSRPDVDADRLGVTGISGGGAATFWIAAADERVKVAVPVSGMSDLESYISHKVINGHCDCMFLINTYQWEWTTIAALVAPRPLLFANSDKDPIFPMDGNRRVIARLRELYKMYDKPELVDDYVSKGDHAYRPDLRIAVFKWINKHLKHDTSEVQDADFKELPGKDVRVFPEENDIPKDAINGKIDETFVPKAEVKLPKEGEFAEWKKGLLKELRDKSFRGFPAEIPSLKAIDESLGRFTSDSGIEVHITKSRESQSLIVVDQQFPEDVNTGAEAMEILKDNHPWLLFPRGVMYNRWTLTSPPNFVNRSHALLGRTVDEGRVWDIIAAAKHLRKEKKAPRRMVGVGTAGILVAYAALFEPSIKEIVIINPPRSHHEGPTFLNIMRVLDIPDALGMLAPDVKLTLVNAKDKAFDRTAEIYRLAGAADNLQRK
jgi:dienelactone hydrolase